MLGRTGLSVPLKMSKRDLLTAPTVSQSSEKNLVDNHSKKHSFRLCSSLKWCSSVQYEFSAIAMLLSFCPVQQLICALTGIVYNVIFWLTRKAAAFMAKKPVDCCVMLACNVRAPLSQTAFARI